MNIQKNKRFLTNYLYCSSALTDFDKDFRKNQIIFKNRNEARIVPHHKMNKPVNDQYQFPTIMII